MTDDPYPGRAFPHVEGRCPACGGASLFLGEGGYVTCARLDCPEPTAVSDELARPTPAWWPKREEVELKRLEARTAYFDRRDVGERFRPGEREAFDAGWSAAMYFAMPRRYVLGAVEQ